MRTPAALFRGTGRLCQGQTPGRPRYAFVPLPVAIRSSAGSPPHAEGASLARLTVGAGRQAKSSSFRGAGAGVGETLGWCFGTKPVITETASADLACPPTH